MASRRLVGLTKSQQEIDRVQLRTRTQWLRAVWTRLNSEHRERLACRMSAWHETESLVLRRNLANTWTAPSSRYNSRASVVSCHHVSHIHYRCTRTGVCKGSVHVTRGNDLRDLRSLVFNTIYESLVFLLLCSEYCTWNSLPNWVVSASTTNTLWFKKNKLLYFCP